MSKKRLPQLAALTAGAVMLAATTSSHPRASAKPQRIVSLNLCSDQLVLALADRAQIAGVSSNARDPDMSAEAARAEGLRVLGTSAEQLLAIGPDLAVGMPLPRNAFLSRYRALELRSPETVADIYRTIRQTAAAIGQPARGEALIARMQRDLAAIPRRGNGKVAVHYQRRGYVTGTGTLIDDLMRRSGLVNLASKLRKPPLSRMSLEEIVAARPDYLIVESATARVADQGTEMLHHPALRGIPRIVIPEAWTVCGGPAYVLAARSIAAQLARHEGRSATHQNRARTPA